MAESPTIMNQVLVAFGISDDLSQLLQRPACARACGDVHVRQSACAVLDDDEHVQHPKRRRDGDEEVAGEDPPCDDSSGMSTSAGRRGGRPGDRFGKYLRTVRGEIRIPSLSSSSLAIRSWPHSTFSRAILRISSRSSFGIGGRPTRDFIRQRSLQPARCQRIIVAGCTTTNALRQSKSLARTAKLTRVAASTRRGWRPRSMYSASCRRRKRFSAWIDSVERNSSTSQRRPSSIRRSAIPTSVAMR